MSLLVAHAFSVVLAFVPGAAPPTPTSVEATPSTICTGESLTLSGEVGRGVTIDWYADSCGGTFVASGVEIVVSPSVSTNYFARARDLRSGLVSETCASVATVVGPAPVAPTNISQFNPMCFGGTLNVTLTAQGGSGATVEWFKSECGGTVIATGVSKTFGITEPTTFYARWTTACGASACASRFVDYVVPEAPTSITAFPSAELCAGQGATLTANGGSGVQVRWFKDGWESNPCAPWPLCASIGSGTTLNVTPTATTTYSAVWIGTCGQNNWSDMVSMTVTVTEGDKNCECATDLNGDGVVNGAEIALLLGSWGSCPGCPADINADGSVNGVDITAILGTWGPCE